MIAFGLFLLLSLWFWGVSLFRFYRPCDVPVTWMSFLDIQRCAEYRGLKVDAL